MNRRWLLAVLVLALVASARAQYLETTIPVGFGPTSVLWNPTSNKVYTTHPEDSYVSIVDGALNTVIGTIAVPADGSAIDLCWNPASNKVYCTSSDPDWLTVIDGAGDSLLKRVRMRGAPTRMAFSAAVNKLYVNCGDDYALRVYDGSSDTLVTEVWTGDHNLPYTLLWHPGSNRVFCTTRCDAAHDTVLAIDCVTDSVAERRAVGDQPYAISWNPVNSLVYSSSADTVYALSPQGDSVIAVIPLARDYLRCLEAVPFPNKVYSSGAGWLSIIDCDLHVVVDSLPNRVYAFSTDTDRAKVYGAARDFVYVFDARLDTLIMTIPVGSSPQAICWNRTDSRVYISDYGSGLLYVIRDTSTAVAEAIGGFRTPEQPIATMLHGRLTLRGPGPAALFDMSGRQRLTLHAGENDVAELPRGVYFVSPASGAGRGASGVTKVVLQH